MSCLNTLEFEEFNDDCDTEEDTSFRWNNDEAVIEDDNPDGSDAGSAVTVDDSDDGFGHTVTNDTDGGDNNSDFDAIVSDSDDVGDVSASDPDTRAGDGANDADDGTCSVANDADIFDDSDSDANSDADADDVASDGKGGGATNECDDDCEDTSLNDADADTTKLDNNTTWLRLGEEVSVVGNKVSGLLANDSVTNCIDDAWIPDVWSWMGVVTSVGVAVLFVSLTCEA